MRVNQKTLKSSFVLKGVGLHTGKSVTVTVNLHPQIHGLYLSVWM